jgi:hypothetical protein
VSAPALPFTYGCCPGISGAGSSATDRARARRAPTVGPSPAACRLQQPCTAEDVAKIVADFAAVAGEGNAQLLAQLLAFTLPEVGPTAACTRPPAPRRDPLARGARLAQQPGRACGAHVSQVGDAAAAKQGVVLGPISSKDTRRVRARLGAGHLCCCRPPCRPRPRRPLPHTSRPPPPRHWHPHTSAVLALTKHAHCWPLVACRPCTSSSGAAPSCST